jgi:hypothetical protein
MVTDELGRQLHDRATLGETLSLEEQAQLEDWYAAQDSAEAADLGLTVSAETITVLQAQVALALEQVTITTQRIQEITEENQALRQEIATLRQQLAQVLPQPV